MIFKKLISIIISLAIIFSYTPLVNEVHGAYSGNIIDLSDNAPPSSGTGWAYSNNVYTLAELGNVNIKNPNSYTSPVWAGETLNLNIKGENSI